jgi:hypothetical protein
MEQVKTFQGNMAGDIDEEINRWLRQTKAIVVGVHHSVWERAGWSPRSHRLGVITTVVYKEKERKDKDV